MSWDTSSYGVGERFDSEYDVATQPKRTEESEVAETTRSEEQLHVGTDKVATGKARLRKYVVTEHQNVTVPVTRGEVRVEREPITNGEADDIGDHEAEVTTYAERPVVSTEKVAKV
jgi:stress response protein YsnF